MKVKKLLLAPTLVAAALALTLPVVSHAAPLATSNGAAVSSDVTQPTWVVTIDAFIDGVQATAATADNAAFPMSAKWSNTIGIGPGTGDYTLSPTPYGATSVPYEAVTSPMKNSSNYETHQLNTWTETKAKGGQTVGDGTVAGKNARACTTGSKFVYLGQSQGATLQDAESTAPMTGSHASFRNLDGNGNIIIWDAYCLTATDSTWAPMPGNDATTTSAALTQISWSPVADSYGTVSYYYEIASAGSNTKNPNGSFATPVYVSGALSTPSIQTPGTPDGNYVWHVWAVDAKGNRTAWSPEFKLNVVN